jgi:DNA (cytosine-5)-methyltransferase 1
LDLVGNFSRLVVELKPEVVTMENVCRLRKHVVYKTFVQELTGLGYHVDSVNVECLGFGVPQTRKRLVLLASRYGPIELIPYTYAPSRYRSVRCAIGKLERIKAGGVSVRDGLHRAAGLSPVNAKRIKAAKPGECWRDWDKNLIAECHKKDAGETYPSVYGRMEWDKPAPTLTTQFYGFGNGRFGHPEQDRALSLREGALLQTFPRHYKFVKPGSPIYFNRVGRHIGNAIPVKLARAIAKSITLHLERYR